MNHPAQLGPYPITGVIGQGSMGVVYKGFDPLIERPVAIKTIRRDLLDGSDQGASIAARFKVEAQAAGRLNHAGIVSIYHFGEDADCAYIVMEYVEGHSLREYVSRGRRFGEGDILCVMTQLLDALDFAHERGVLHRDIKPANLIITRDGRLKVTDFGIARIESAQLTRVNAVIGSPGYMAPEQYVGDVLDRRVDVFSAGVLLYQLLTGSLPFTGTDDAVMYKIIYGEPTLPSQTEGGAGWLGYDPVIAAALAKTREQRYPSARAFRDALRSVAAVRVPEAVSPAALLPSPATSDPGTLQTPAAVAGAARGTIDEAVRERPSQSPAKTTFAMAGGSAEGGATRWTGPATSAPSTPAPTGWDERLLGTIERELARYVGPMARVLVRRAARTVANPQDLRQLLAQNIPSAADQRAFLLQPGGTRTASRPGSLLAGTITRLRGRPRDPATADESRTQGGERATQLQPPGTGARATGGSTRAGVSVNSLPITPEVVEHAIRVMTRHIGPIARVMVRKAAQELMTREQLFLRLAAEFKTEVEREKVYDDLRRPQ